MIGTGGQASARGSSAFVDGVRWLMTLATMSADQAKRQGIPEAARRDYLVASLAKSNYGALIADTVLERGPDGVLGVSSVGQSTQSPEQLLVTLIIQEAIAGRTYSATAFEKEFGGPKKAFGMGMVALRRRIAGAIAAGYLAKDTGQQAALIVGPVPVP
jgi:hypothetical protein